MRLARRGLIACLLAVCLLAVGAAALRPRAGIDPAKTGYPNSMAALGDSITRAFDSAGLFDQVRESWATGTDPTVNSIYNRILQVNPGISGHAFNDAVSGAKMTNLDGQATSAVSQDVDLLTVLMGANDVCTSSESTMTPVARFQTQFQAAMNTLSSGLPDARIAVASIPNVYNLWVILKDNANARASWSVFGICQSLLANPLSTAPADVHRRNNVRQRNIDLNGALATVCAQYIHCRFDNNAAFNGAFTPSGVSVIDYFHPSVQGQTLAASIVWGATFDITDATMPVSSAAMVPGHEVNGSAAEQASEARLGLWGAKTPSVSVRRHLVGGRAGPSLRARRHQPSPIRAADAAARARTPSTDAAAPGTQGAGRGDRRDVS